MFSSTSEYAIRAMLVLAAKYGREPLRADQVADAIGAPRNYMGKTLNALTKSGLLKSSRGPLGGFSLTLAPNTITLARIIDCFVEERTHSQCLLGNRPCDGLNPCAAHKLWTEILKSRREPLALTTLADLLKTPLDKSLPPRKQPTIKTSQRI